MKRGQGCGKPGHIGNILDPSEGDAATHYCETCEEEAALPENQFRREGMIETTDEDLKTRAQELVALKAGDHVVLGSGYAHERRLIIKPVVRVTNTQIILLGNNYRFYRANGRKVGSFVGAPYIKSRATPADIAAYELQEAKQQQKTRNAELEREAIRRAQESLEKLFALPFVPSVSQWTGDDSKDKFEVTFVLTEKQVRELAIRASR